MKRIAALALLLGPFLVATAVAESCKFSADRSVNLEGPVRKVVLGAGAGDLNIRGDSGGKVSASGRACASSDELLAQITLESRREGDTVYLKTVMPEHGDNWLGPARYAYMDLTVVVPRSAELSVADSSGALELSNAQSAVIDDSSGEQILRDIAGDLDVTDSSGAIRIERVGGNLQLKDSSGAVDISEVRGNVDVSVDSSGDLRIAKVTGSVHIVNDSSGDIQIEDVQKDVTIDTDSSGGIRVTRVGGSFTVGSDGSGGISYDRVVGSVRVPRGE